jgi:hypothetical protein
MGKTHKPAAWLLLTSMTLTTISYSGEDEMGFSTYFFSDSGENSVITTSFNLAKQLLEQTILLIDIELDNVTVPPVTAVTGATRPQRNKGEAFEKNRGQVILGIEQGLGGGSAVALNAYRSQEVDYISNSVLTTYTQELFARNTSLTIRGQFNSDQVGEILDDGGVLNRPKHVYTGIANLSQLLSPTTVADLAYDYVLVDGFQSDPYRQVSVRDNDGVVTQTDELHPANRTRQAATGKLSQSIPSIEAALIGSYRYYFDTWDVHSHTVEMKLNKYVLKDLVLGIDYRYYVQTGAYFWHEQYAGDQYLQSSLRTADYKLKPFTSNNVGFSLTWLFRGLAEANKDLSFLRNSSMEVEYFRYFNDLEFSADILQTSLRFSL